VLIKNITIPSKAIDVDHAPLPGSVCKGFFVTCYGVGFTLKSDPRMMALSNSVSNALLITARLLRLLTVV
jgi:hypothetical protein